ncbi:MAG: MSHA biogenesis protein MshK [Parashewanella sp.]
MSLNSNKYFIWVLTITCTLLLSDMAHAERLQDPTKPNNYIRPMASIRAVTGEAVLNSIITGTPTLAVINQQIKTIGDRVQGSKITKITSNSVSLADGRTLVLYQGANLVTGNK